MTYFKNFQKKIIIKKINRTITFSATKLSFLQLICITNLKIKKKTITYFINSSKSSHKQQKCSIANILNGFINLGVGSKTKTFSTKGKKINKTA